MSSNLSSRFKNKNETISTDTSVPEIIEEPVISTMSQDTEADNTEIELITDDEAVTNEENSDINSELEISLDMTDIHDTLKKQLDDKIESIPCWFEYSKARQSELIRSFIENQITENKFKLTEIQKASLLDDFINTSSDFGAVQYLIDNKKVTSITINGTKSIYIEIDGKILNTETNLTSRQLDYIVASIKSIMQITQINNTEKFYTDKYIITIINEKYAKSGMYINIKKLNNPDKSYITENKIISGENFDFIISAIIEKKNIVISGAVNTFKTSLINAILPYISEKRVYIAEEKQQININSRTISKFIINQNDEEYSTILSELIKFEPEYLITDFNSFDFNTIKKDGSITTIRSNSIDNTFKMLVNSYIQSGLSEKYAKTRMLTDIDYIIHFDKNTSGVSLQVLAELTPARTLQASIKYIVG